MPYVTRTRVHHMFGVRAAKSILFWRSGKMLMQRREGLWELLCGKVLAEVAAPVGQWCDLIPKIKVGVSLGFSAMVDVPIQGMCKSVTLKTLADMLRGARELVLRSPLQPW